MSITPKIEHRDFDESDYTILQETIVDVIEPTTLKSNDDILSIEYESFSYGFDVNMSLDVDLCAEYESFPFNSIQTNILFETCKFEAIESDNLVIMNFNLGQTLLPFEIKRLVDFRPTILRGRLIHDDDPISRPMIDQLASLSYICLFDVWARHLIS